MAFVKCEGEDSVIQGNKARKKKCSSKAVAVIEFKAGARRFVCKRHIGGGTVLRRFPPGSSAEEVGPK